MAVSRSLSTMQPRPVMRQSGFEKRSHVLKNPQTLQSATRCNHAPNSSKFRAIRAASSAASSFNPLDRCGLRAILLEVEVLVLFLGRHANITTGREAPVIRRDSGTIDKFHQPLDVAQPRVREMLLEPVGLPNKIARLPQRLDRRARASSSALRARLISALSQSSESRASRSFTLMSITRPASLAARSICLVRSRQRSANGCSATRAAFSPALSRSALDQPFARAAASASKASISAVSVACSLVNSSHGSASGSSVALDPANGSTKSANLPSAAS